MIAASTDINITCHYKFHSKHYLLYDESLERYDMIMFPREQTSLMT